jgi:hypothetical protein
VLRRGLQQVIDNRHDGRILSRELAFKVSWRYVGGSGDLIHGGGVVPLAHAEIQGGIDQALAAVVIPIAGHSRSLSPNLLKSPPNRASNLAVGSERDN